MMGVVFQLLHTCVADAFGDATWQRAQEAAGGHRVFAAHQRYDDAEFDALVAVIATERGIDVRDVHRWFGETALPHFYRMSPHFFDAHRDSWSFLLTLNDVIHPQVRRRYPDAQVPDFEFSANHAGDLSILYRSPRRMCAFAEGLILGALRHYGDTSVLRHSRCMHRGDASCEFVLQAPLS